MAVVLAISGGVAVLMLVRSSATVGFDTSATSEATSTDTAQPPATPLVAATPTSTPPPANSPPPATTGANSAAPTDTPKRVAAQPDVLDVSGLSFSIVGCANGTSCLNLQPSRAVIAPPTAMSRRHSVSLSAVGMRSTSGGRRSLLSASPRSPTS
jgi:hypothetical protein